MAEGSIEKRKEILGYSAVQVTERYAHLRTDLSGARDLGTIAIDLRAGPTGTSEIGHAVATGHDESKQQIA